MKNIIAELNGSILTLTINLDTVLGASKSGKSNSIATSRGNQNLKFDGYEDVKLGINCFRLIPKELRK